MGTPVVLGNGEGCLRVASLLVGAWEDNTRQSIRRGTELQTWPHQDTAGTPCQLCPQDSVWERGARHGGLAPDAGQWGGTGDRAVVPLSLGVSC